MLWVVIVAGITAACMAWSIGANDVANTMGTSVGSKALSITQAVIFAGLCEFLGSVFMGSRVSGTFMNVLGPTQYCGDEYIFQIAMFCTLFGAFIWLLIATYVKLPVSTTHTIVGGLIGVGVVAKGWESVSWVKLGITALSWVTSPIIGGIFSFLIYGSIHLSVLRTSDTEKIRFRSLLIVPFFSALCFAVVTAFILFDGPPGMRPEWEFYWNFVVAIGVFVIMYLATFGFLIFRPNISAKLTSYMASHPRFRTATQLPVLRSIFKAILDDEHGVRDSQRVYNNEETNSDSSDSPLMDNKPNQSYAEDDENNFFKEENPNNSNETRIDFNPDDSTGVQQRSPTASTPNSPDSPDLPDSPNLNDNNATERSYLEIEEESEQDISESSVEKHFKLLMVLTALVLSFSHGGNDVANAIGPYAAVIATWEKASLCSPSPDDLIFHVPIWVLILGGGCIVIGLGTWGYRVMTTVGQNITKLTFSRGFSAQLGTALSVLICTHIGVPVSTTHVLIGAICGVGIITGRNSLNFSTLRNIVISWVVTVPFAAIGSVLLFLLMKLIFQPSGDNTTE
eukprot:gb/GECH01013427.1/.p1 GENE.gb/GECH01013427.1/~~gb/GECH01013427.1/.p1  ORF type:complete len:567 (+),score=114.72 gb/GECH01013427.1/:1-1701(+)